MLAMMVHIIISSNELLHDCMMEPLLLRMCSLGEKKNRDTTCQISRGPNVIISAVRYS